MTKVTHKLRICNAYRFSTQQWLRERVPILRYESYYDVIGLKGLRSGAAGNPRGSSETSTDIITCSLEGYKVTFYKMDFVCQGSHSEEGK
jgi:hypothetical protein